MRRDARKLCLDPRQLQDMYPNSDRRPLLRILDEEPVVIPETIPEETPAEPQPIQSIEIIPDDVVVSSDDDIDVVDAPIIPQPLNLYDSSSASLWKGGDQRDYWCRPCSRGYRSILVADSQVAVLKDCN